MATKLLTVVIAVVLLHLPVAAAAVVKDRHNRTKDWGKPEYVHCVQPYTWYELVYGYKNSSVAFKVGGLGKLLEKGGYQTWQCFPDHYCAADANDPWFCFVYHETAKVFTAWGENSRLKLVRVQGTEDEKAEAGRPCNTSICFDFIDYEDGNVVESDYVIGEKSFTFTAWITASAMDQGIILSRGRRSNGESQFRVQSFLDNRIGIMVDGFMQSGVSGTTKDTNGYGTLCHTRTPLTVNQEYHLTVVRVGPMWFIFLDGELETDGGCWNSRGVTDVYFDPTRRLRVGSYAPSHGEGSALVFEGRIHHAALHPSSVFTQEDIRMLLGSNVSSCIA